MTVISVEQISKKYIIRHQKQGNYLTLRDTIVETVKNAGRRLTKPKGDPDRSREEFWALKEVSFEVKQGDRVGIIGRNGAGKSTLLKILSRVTEPTSGRLSIRGRVASLLEVGTGFHPELTGRENIFLNGAILGMSRDEIKRKFDEIVEFAEVERFLDTPVKRYSSGMYVRLAFAVAAHLEPEILIVDEVLAVGDARFQKKCLGKMEDVGKDGRTILFVSHNMNAVETLCNCAVLLDKGKLKHYSNNVGQLVKSYMGGDSGESTASEWVNIHDKEFQNHWFKPLRFLIADRDGNRVDMPLSNTSDMWVYIEGEIKEFEPALTVGYAVYSEEGSLLYWSYHTDTPEDTWPVLGKGSYVFRSKIPARLLNEGNYRVELIASLHFRQWLCEPAVTSPSIHLSIQGGLSDSPYWIAKRPGLLGPVLSWDVEKKPSN